MNKNLIERNFKRKRKEGISGKFQKTKFSSIFFSFEF